MIHHLHRDEEILSAYPIMRQLRTHLEEEEYKALVREAMEVDRYHLVAYSMNGAIVSVVGFKPMTTLYYGRFVWVCDLVTDEMHRSKGLGEILLSYVEDWARQHAFTSVALSSGLSRHGAHDFYEEQMGYDRVSYVFKRVFN
ncbi:N-acetyltransferase [Pontibacillus halophilus JSM 076056 = DSM 19796]|uniref:N-acetyltransferase n=1 Tax=Pontibacillus halophilus JSM 076056 = DSM 19796 TaxID=1385510 RepID=A0A0A5I5K3_9BACI|nr:GNAT family N-acetyltransferase [Pontibacillus halophilus]KGX91107.1 N-acetyltransferase [Pontibacillus halophilus JSM 076056 = DSM 19796]